MSRLRRIAHWDRIFFVTSNLRKHDSLNDAERDIVLSVLEHHHAKRDFFLFGFVMMPTHLHLLLAPDRFGLAVLIYRFKRSSARLIEKHRGQTKAIWQPRYFDFALRRAGDFWDKLEYIHNNPVEARLARSPNEWRWSSAAPGVCLAHPGLKLDAIDLPVDRKTKLHRGPRE